MTPAERKIVYEACEIVEVMDSWSCNALYKATGGDSWADNGWYHRDRMVLRHKRFWNKFDEIWFNGDGSELTREQRILMLFSSRRPRTMSDLIEQVKARLDPEQSFHLQERLDAISLETWFAAPKTCAAQIVRGTEKSRASVDEALIACARAALIVSSVLRNVDRIVSGSMAASALNEALDQLRKAVEGE